MRILLAKNIIERAISHHRGRTGAENKSKHDFLMSQDSHYKRYWTIMEGYAGQWVPVDTKYLFTQSFNAVLDDNGMFHVEQFIVDNVDLEPEFKNIEEWKEAVRQRYAKDWPGTNVDHEMQFWHSRLTPINRDENSNL